MNTEIQIQYTIYFSVPDRCRDYEVIGEVHRLCRTYKLPGHTLYEAAGGWRDPETGEYGMDNSYVLSVLLPQSSSWARRMILLSMALKDSFEQKEVLIIRSPVEVLS